VTGRVVVLNGTASAGKSTLASAIQRMADSPWLIVAQDDFAQALVPRWVSFHGGGPGFNFVRTDDGLLHVEAGAVGRRLLRAYRFAAAAVARAECDVVVDECTFDADGRQEWEDALAGIDVMWVRVECDLDVCEARERARPDRALLHGLARGQYDRVHGGVAYDLTVDLTHGDSDGAARAILDALQPT
jgi:chloramphenicol 3-O phosphotransferase